MINSSLLKAAFYKPRSTIADAPGLPVGKLTREHQINAAHCEQYNRLVKWKPGIASVIHPNYLQVLTLPMQLAMMTTQPFPFKPMGLVHLANSIKVAHLPDQNAKISLKTSFSGLAWHKKGWVFALLSEGHVDGELAVSGTSFYLSRQRHASGEQVVSHSGEDSMIQMPFFNAPIEGVSHVESVQFPLGIGRKYARNSGDFNPIHLTRWTAKLMGFKQAIAHGMYSKALCLSQVLKREILLGETRPSEASMTFSTQFMQPIYLPTFGELRLAYPNEHVIDTLQNNAQDTTQNITQDITQDITQENTQINDKFSNGSNTRVIECSLLSKNRAREREHLRTIITIN